MKIGIFIVLGIIVLAVLVGILLMNYSKLDDENKKLRDDLAKEIAYHNTLIIHPSDDVIQRAQKIIWRHMSAGTWNFKEAFKMKIDGEEVDFSQASVEIYQGAYEGFIKIKGVRLKEEIK